MFAKREGVLCFKAPLLVPGLRKGDFGLPSHWDFGGKEGLGVGKTLVPPYTPIKEDRKGLLSFIPSYPLKKEGRRELLFIYTTVSLKKGDGRGL